MEILLEAKEVTLVTKSVNALKDFIERYTSMMKDLIISLIGKTSYNKIEKALKAIKKLLSSGLSKLNEKKLRIVIGLLVSTLGYIAIVNRKLIVLVSKNASHFIKALGKMTLEVLSIIKNLAPTFFKNIISVASDIATGEGRAGDRIANSLKTNVVFNLPLLKMVSIAKSALKIAYYNSKLKKYIKGISLLRDQRSITVNNAKLAKDNITSTRDKFASKKYNPDMSYRQNMDKAMKQDLERNLTTI